MHSANLVANRGNTSYGVESVVKAGLNISQKFHLPDFQEIASSYTDYIWFKIKVLAESPCPTNRFTCPGPIGQWNMSSPEECNFQTQ